MRAVIADRGELDSVPIHLEHAADGDGFAFRLGVRAGVGGQETARIPVRRRINPAPHPLLKEIYYCEVAGTTLEAANVFALKAKVATLLDTIAPARTLPLCYFRVPAMDYELPVYEEGGAVHSPVLGGPRLRARDLAGIRERICEYLISAGYVNDLDEVEVGVVRPRDLRQVPPAAVFRSYVDCDLWLPSVEGVSADGPVVGVLGQAARLRAPERPRAGTGLAGRNTAPAAPDVVALLRFVRTDLQRARATSAPEAVYAAEVRPEIWRAAEQRTDHSGASLVAYLSDHDGTRLELPVRRTGAGDVAVALDDRGINIFLAPDEGALAACIGRYLARHEFLRFADEVHIEATEPERPEQLDTDAILSLGDGAAVADTIGAVDGREAVGAANQEGAERSPEEVPARWS